MSSRDNKPSHAPNEPGVSGTSIEAWERLIQQPTRFLDRWTDPGMDIPTDLDREHLILAEINRIARALVCVQITGSIPRRLGIEADDEELAIDKKRSRRVAHALSQSLDCWGRKPPKIPMTKEIEREGAQLEWLPFAADHALNVEASLRLIVTWSIRNDDQRWGRSAVVYLENELRWMAYALRD